MDGIIQLVKLLLFANSIVLTNEPITISNEVVEISLEKPIEAINSRASIEVDLSHLIEEKGINANINAVSDLLPKECVFASLISENGDEFVLNRTGASSQRHLIIYHSEGIPVDLKFIKVKLSFCKTINKVNVIWRNAAK